MTLRDLLVPGASDVQLSIVVPFHDAADQIDGCVAAALVAMGDLDVELLLVDDGSVDDGADVADRWTRRDRRVRCLRSPINRGPGHGRNLGIAAAHGTWLVFVDVDDRLRPDALTTILAAAALPDVGDLVLHTLVPDGCTGDEVALLADGTAVHEVDRDRLLERFLSLRTDGAVTFAAAHRDLVGDAPFADGLHEDIDVLWSWYRRCRAPVAVAADLYEKVDRPGSIVHTVTTAHLDGAVRAWLAVGRDVAHAGDDSWRALHAVGAEALLATRVRAIHRLADADDAARLYDHLHTVWTAAFGGLAADHRPRATTYRMVAEEFLRTATDVDDERYVAFTEWLAATLGRSWSCTDLHRSVFLGPDEVRTCCKRFFVDGEQRGDVVLLLVASGDVTAGAVLDAKRSLHTAVNAGEATPCDGCPFLEHADWGPIAPLEVAHLSMEHHSVCNLRCTYCSDTYYGGARPSYDVPALLDDLVDAGGMTGCRSVVWGGGEPTADPDFARMTAAVAAAAPRATQRILSNAVLHDPTVADLVADGRAVLTTSIDAGTEETFLAIRGQARLHRVLENLRSYAGPAPERVTVKYILTEGNTSLDEVRAFCDLIARYELTRCNLQLSMDFTEEVMPSDAVMALVVMDAWLRSVGCEVVFVDDLVLQRLTTDHDPAMLRARLGPLDASAGLAEPAGEAVSVWGPGWQARHLVDRSSFFRSVDVLRYVDSRPGATGGRFLDRPVVGPDALLASDEQILIAASQSYPLLHRQFRELGVDTDRLVRGVVL